MRTLYEDNHLLVAVKPPNMLSQGDATGDASMLDILKDYIKEKYNKPGAVYLGLVHRLDRPAGGLMVFARTSKAAARLAEQMRERGIEKEYLAVVEGCPPGGTLTHWIVKEGQTSRIAEEGTPGAKRALLSYERVETQGSLSLLRIRLETGRSHQIRLQMAAIGHPLWGDHRYGHGSAGEQLALWAWRLCFTHPTLRERLCFEEKPPSTRPWSLFMIRNES